MSPFDRKTNDGDVLHDAAHPLSCLAPREYEVARLRLDGLSALEVAERLGIKPTSVRTTMHRVYKKCGVADLRELQAVSAVERTGRPQTSDYPLTQQAHVNELADSFFLMARVVYSVVAPAFIFLAFFAPAAPRWLSITELSTASLASAGAMMGLLIGHAFDALVARSASRGVHVACSVACTVCHLSGALVATACIAAFADPSWAMQWLPSSHAPLLISRLFYILVPLVVSLAATLGNARYANARLVDDSSTGLPYPLLRHGCALCIAAALAWNLDTSSLSLSLALLTVLASAVCAGARLAVCAGGTLPSSAVGSLPSESGNAPSTASSVNRRALWALAFSALTVGFYTCATFLPFRLVMLEYLQVCTLVAFAAIGAWQLWITGVATSDRPSLMRWIVPRVALFVLSSLLLTPVISTCLLAMLFLERARSMLAPAASPRIVYGAVALGIFCGAVGAPAAASSLFDPLLGGFAEHADEFLAGAALLALSLLGLAAYWWGSAQAVDAYESRVLRRGEHRSMFSEPTERVRAFLVLRGLNGLQIDVALMTAAGESVNSIAGKLNYSPSSIRAARQTAYRACGVHGAVELHLMISQVERV